MTLVIFIGILAILLPMIGVLFFFYHGIRDRRWPKQALLTIPTGLALFIAAGILYSANQAVQPEEANQAQSSVALSSSSHSKSSSATSQSESSSSSKTSSDSTEKEKASSSKKEAASSSEKKQSSRSSDEAIERARQTVQSHAPNVPDGASFVKVNDNIPFFTNADLTQTDAYAHYGTLDHLGRVTTANALLDESLMPPEERGSMDASIKPTGWHQARYKTTVPGGWLYNRSHLVGYQLAGSENDPKNLMTGTRWFNVEGMLPFENFVAHYIESSGNHVRYRITPVFEGNNLLATGIFMEGFSIEDNGDGLCFNIFVPNRQPGVIIDYATGKSHLDQ
ncbi:MAG: DNA/RNA non-specific endonuclease [Aerococcus sp.]|nr:DNA/RNA non-specific endonuclease [Aerococcus sp.]